MENTKQLYEDIGNALKEVFPVIKLESVIEATSDKSVDWLLAHYNHYYIDWHENVENTRADVPVRLRRKGLRITYYNGSELITEYFTNDDTTEWLASKNWFRVTEFDTRTYVFAGVADHTTIPEEDINYQIYFAYEGGTYPGFDNIEITEGMNVILKTTGGWKVTHLFDSSYNKATTDDKYVDSAGDTMKDGAVLTFVNGKITFGTGNTNIEKDNISAPTINAVTKIAAPTVKAYDIETLRLDATEKVQSPLIKGDNGVFVSSTIGSLNVTNSTVDTETVKNLTVKEENVETSDINNGTIANATITSEHVGASVVDNLRANEAIIANSMVTSESATYATIKQADITHLSANELISPNVNATTLTSDSAIIKNAAITTETVSTSTITNLTATESNVTTEYVENLNVRNESADISKIKNATIDAAAITAENVKTSTVGKANITYETVDTSEIKTLTVDRGTIANLDVTAETSNHSTIETANIKNANVDIAGIDTESVNVSTVTKQTVANSTITNGTIADANIKKATVESSIVTSGTANEYKITNLTTDSAIVNNLEATNSYLDNAQVESMTFTTIQGETVQATAVNVTSVSADTIKADNATLKKATITTLQAPEFHSDSVETVKLKANQSDLDTAAIKTAKITTAAVDVIKSPAAIIDRAEIAVGNIGEADIEHNITATNLIKRGGTNVQVLMADGSVQTIGVPNGIATLDNTGNLPLSQLGNVDTILFEICPELPYDIKTIKKSRIYIVPRPGGAGGATNLYKEYVYTGDLDKPYNADAWEELGEITNEVDLTAYARIDGTTFTGDVFIDYGHSLIMAGQSSTGDYEARLDHIDYDQKSGGQLSLRNSDNETTVVINGVNGEFKGKSFKRTGATVEDVLLGNGDIITQEELVKRYIEPLPDELIKDLPDFQFASSDSGSNTPTNNDINSSIQ